MPQLLEESHLGLRVGKEQSLLGFIVAHRVEHDRMTCACRLADALPLAETLKGLHFVAFAILMLKRFVEL